MLSWLCFAPQRLTSEDWHCFCSTTSYLPETVRFKLGYKLLQETEPNSTKSLEINTRLIFNVELQKEQKASCVRCVGLLNKECCVMSPVLSPIHLYL